MKVKMNNTGVTVARVPETGTGSESGPRQRHFVFQTSFPPGPVLEATPEPPSPFVLRRFPFSGGLWTVIAAMPYRASLTSKWGSHGGRVGSSGSEPGLQSLTVSSAPCSLGHLNGSVLSCVKRGEVSFSPLGRPGGVKRGFFVFVLFFFHVKHLT